MKLFILLVLVVGHCCACSAVLGSDGEKASTARPNELPNANTDSGEIDKDELSQLEELWKYAVRDSFIVKRLSSEFRKSFSLGEIEKECFRMFALYVSNSPPRSKSRDPDLSIASSPNVVLTDPDLEPDYPRPQFDEQPPYLLGRKTPRMVKEAPVNDVAVQIIDARRLRESIRDLLTQLLCTYKAYKAGLVLPKSSSTQEATAVARKMLTMLAGEEGVKSLDRQLEGTSSGDKR